MANVKNFGLVGVGTTVQFGKAGPSLGQQTTTILKADGTAAFRLPSGDDSNQPTALVAGSGAMRFNSDSGQMEYSNGTVWADLATGGAAVESVTGTLNRITITGTATDPIVDIASTYVGQTSITTLGTVTAGTWNGTTIAVANGGTGLDTSAAANGQLLIGNGSGLVLNTITGGTGVTVTNGAGSITIDIDNTEVVTSVASSGGTITVSPGTGAVDISLPNVGTPVTASFVKITTDAQGRVSATTPVVTADITALVDATYVNLAGDTMTGNLNMGANYVTMTNAPVADTDGANKAYVDSIANGLSWKQAVLAATTGNITLSGAQTIDGVSVVAGNRVLVKNQSTAADNGIYVAAAGAWTRATDADTPSELDGAAVFVQQGTVNLDSGWTQTATIATVGVTAQTWVQFSGGTLYTWGTGLIESGNTVSVNLGAGIAELPSDEVGIDLYDAANNPLILTLDGATRDNSGPGPTAAAKLGLLLDGSSLSMGAGGLRVAAGGVNLTTMVTGVLPPANGGTGVANAPTSTITLGGALATSGAFDSTFTMTGTTTVTFPQTGTLATVGGTVASFSTGTTGLLANGNANTPTTGAVVLSGILDVDNGGTGLAAVTANYVPYGAGTSPLALSSAFQFDGTDTLTVGTATIEGGVTDVTITATATNGDINLNPNGTGAVVIGPAGAGLIQSDSNQNLTVQATGTGVLALTSGGDLVINLAASNAFKVSVVGPSDAQYVSGLANNDLVTKYYVDTVAGNSTGDVKAVQETVSLGANASTNIGAALPAGATILSVKVNVTVVNTTSTLVVGKSGGSQYMVDTENDPQTTGLYLAETMVTEAGSEQVQATVAGQTGGVGSCVVIVTYKLA